MLYKWTIYDEWSNLIREVLLGRMQRGVKGIIITAARGIFAQYGFRKTTMDEIARAAHLAKSSIYHYFRSWESVPPVFT